MCDPLSLFFSALLFLVCLHFKTHSPLLSIRWLPGPNGADGRFPEARRERMLKSPPPPPQMASILACNHEANGFPLVCIRNPWLRLRSLSESYHKDMKAGIWTWICLCPKPMLASVLYNRLSCFKKSGKMAGKRTPELLPETITSVGSLLVCLHLQRHFFFSFQEKHIEIRCWYESLWRPLSYQDTLHLGAPRVRLTLSRAGFWICPHHLVNQVCSGIWHVLGKEK